MKRWQTKDERITTRVTPNMRRDLERAAKRANVSPSEMVCRAISELLDREKKRRGKR